jgi:hypothetical protein
MRTVSEDSVWNNIATRTRSVTLRAVFLTFHNNNSVALVRERTIPTKRPPLVGDVSANFCG